MYIHLIIFGSAIFTSTWANPIDSACTEVQIPISVASPRFYVNISVENNWDVASLTFNFTRRDSGKPAAPLPISGSTPMPVESKFTVGATMCGTGEKLLVLTHGIIESKL